MMIIPKLLAVLVWMSDVSAVHHQDTIRVKLTVLAKDDVNSNATNRIISKLNAQLSGLADVLVVSTSEADYILAMNLLVKNNNHSKSTAVVIAPVLSRKITTLENKKTFETKFCNIIEAKEGDIETKCAE